MSVMGSPQSLGSTLQILVFYHSANSKLDLKALFSLTNPALLFLLKEKGQNVKTAEVVDIFQKFPLSRHPGVPDTAAMLIVPPPALCSVALIAAAA